MKWNDVKDKKIQLKIFIKKNLRLRFSTDK